MAESVDVVRMLRPEGGWIVECEPFTKKEWTDGFAICDAWIAEQDAAKTAQRQAILDRIGLTADEAKLLLG